MLRKNARLRNSLLKLSKSDLGKEYTMAKEKVEAAKKKGGKKGGKKKGY